MAFRSIKPISYRPCPQSCNNGWIRCSYCGGWGWIDRFNPVGKISIQQISCRACGGKGWISCPTCSGKGSVPRGVTAVICPTCGSVNVETARDILRGYHVTDARCRDCGNMWGSTSAA